MLLLPIMTYHIRSIAWRKKRNTSFDDYAINRSSFC